jgi:hypothetical protein
MTVKDQTALSNNSNVANTKYVDTAISALSSVYQTISGMSAYLTSATASATYATIANYVSNASLSSTLTSYLLTATASATYATIANYVSNASLSSTLTSYQTISGMSAYLSTATASATYATIANYVSNASLSSTLTSYQTISGMSAYLTTATASATYGAKAIANTWDLLQTFTLGITTGTITSPAIGSSIAIGDNQTTGTMTIGTGATRSGSIGIGANSCAVNVGGVLNPQQGITLSADKRITFSTNTANPTATSTILGSVYTGTYVGASTGLTSGADFVVSQITSVPIGVYVATGASSITSSTAPFTCQTPRMQIKNFTATTYHACLQLPTFTVATATEKISMSCAGIVEVSAVSTIQLVVNVVFSSPAIRNTGDTGNFNFRLVRIG